MDEITRMEEVPFNVTNEKKKRRRSVYRDDKQIAHKTRGGVGVVGRALRKGKR